MLVLEMTNLGISSPQRIKQFPTDVGRWFDDGKFNVIRDYSYTRQWLTLNPTTISITYKWRGARSSPDVALARSWGNWTRLRQKRVSHIHFIVWGILGPVELYKFKSGLKLSMSFHILFLYRFIKMYKILLHNKVIFRGYGCIHLCI